jgi:RsiW-degrading membrane proteinase PrsW (M82 family)
MSISLIVWQSLPARVSELGPLRWIVLARQQLRSLADGATSFGPAMLGQVLSVALFEESVKVAPVLLLVLPGKISRGRDAMLIAAWCGLIFGVLEANWYAHVEFATKHTLLGQCLARFLIVPPLHAMWAAISAGLVVVARRYYRRRALNLAAALVAGVLLHGMYNGLSIFGPGLQVIVMVLATPAVFVLSAEGDDTVSPPAAGWIRLAVCSAILLGIMSIGMAAAGM